MTGIAHKPTASIEDQANAAIEVAKRKQEVQTRVKQALGRKEEVDDEFKNLPGHQVILKLPRKRQVTNQNQSVT